MATSAPSRATVRARPPGPGPRTSSATAMSCEPPTISARSSDASTALDILRGFNVGNAEITNGSRNAKSPANETSPSVGVLNSIRV